MTRLVVACVSLVLLVNAVAAAGQEGPYFVTYDDSLEKPGELETSLLSTVGDPRGSAPDYVAPWIELEYGVTSWLTSEVYLEGAAFDGQSAFTGWRFETRVRPFGQEHAVVPVFYVEYEHVTEASRIQKEIVGSGATPDESLGELLDERAREIEARVILSSHVGGWNVSENLIFEKNVVPGEPLEFGYAAAVSRPIGAEANASCRFCADSLAAGLEVYGGLGSTAVSPFSASRHFVAPSVAWHISKGSVLKFSLGVGVTDASERFLLRVGYSVDVW